VFSAIQAASSGVVLGIPWPWPSLNDMFGGMHKKTLITIAARPSMGKTAFMLQIVRSVALSGKRIAVFSLEMSKEKCAGRMLFSQANSCFDSALRGKLPKRDFTSVGMAMHQIADIDVFIDDQGAQTTSQIRQKCRELQQKKPIDIIVVDHLGLVKAPEGSFSRNEEVTKISAGNLELCKMFDCPVIQLSQLSRNCEMRPIPRPMLPDLRDSGTIEQDSDTVIFLYREGYYASVESKNPPDSIEIIFAKHRDGKLGTGLLHSNADTMVFSEIDNIHKEPPWPQSTGADYVK
jgi:replicative DNA helicase